MWKYIRELRFYRQAANNGSIIREDSQQELTHMSDPFLSLARLGAEITASYNDRSGSSSALQSLDNAMKCYQPELDATFRVDFFSNGKPKNEDKVAA
jgi:hypothetical protein